MVKVFQLQILKKINLHDFFNFSYPPPPSHTVHFFYQLFLESLLLTWFWNNVNFCLQSIVHVRHFEMSDKGR